MPYTVIEDAEGCGGYAVVKVGERMPVDGGCHALKSDAMAQMVALNIATEDEERAEPNLKAPSFMAASARRGLRLHEEGESGAGLKPQTVADARKMANGEALSPQKWKKIAPWIARHIVDLDAVQGDEITPGLVAMLLWGGGSSKASARRAQAYAERVSERLDAMEQRAPAPPKDRIKGSKKNPAGSAKGQSGGIVLDEKTVTALRNKAKEHNEEMAKADKPAWTRVRLGALRAVYRRGAGAFSTSHRPGMARGQWAMARVNAFLYLTRNGRPKNPKYVTDNDLLHPDHPKRSEARYDPSQPRDDNGKFASAGGGGGGFGGGDADEEDILDSEDDTETLGGIPGQGTEAYAKRTEDELLAQQKEAMEEVPPFAQDDISGYTGTGYERTNRALRGAPPPPPSAEEVEEANNIADSIDGAIDEMPPTTKPITVYRAASVESLGLERGASAGDIEIGTTIRDNGIVSTTLSEGKVGEFLGPGKTVIEIRVPAGNRVLAAGSLSVHPDEFEILLPTGTKFNVIGKSENKVIVEVG